MLEDNLLKKKKKKIIFLSQFYFEGVIDDFFLGGGWIFLHKSFSYGLLRLLPKFRCPRPSGSGLKGPGGGGVVGGIDQ